MNYKKLLKRISITFLITIAIIFAFGYWFIGLIKADLRQPNMELTQAADLPYLVEDSVAYRGKILAVVTSTEKIGESGKRTGYELTELSRAYYVFQANGFEVDVASPKGGNPPVVIDDDDVGAYDYAFMNDPVAKGKVTNTLVMSDVVFEDYQAVYFVGGKGAMFDFPDNPYIQNLVQQYYESGKTVGAVCHGPASLINVTLSDGTPLLANKSVSGFTNEEELFLIPDAEEIFPFLLQDKMTSLGAQFDAGTMYLKNVVKDGKLITGQNPWSTWELAEQMIQSLGYQPKPRIQTSEETSIEILIQYELEGYSGAKDLVNEVLDAGGEINRELLAVHSITSVMQGDLGKTISMIRLLSYLKGK